MKKMTATYLALALAGTLAAGEVVIDNMKNPSSWSVQRGSKETITATADGLSFAGPALFFRKKISVYPVDGGKEIGKEYQGISFKVKGDGSKEWGTLVFGAGPRIGGQFYFPLKNTAVTEYRVNFADMAPFSDHTFAMPKTLKAGEISEISFGDRWTIGQNNNRRSAFRFQVSDIRLIEKIAPEFVQGKHRPAPLDGVIAKMKAGKPVLILCFGDSITAGTSLKNREQDRYATVLQGLLRKEYKNDKITVRSVAVGGAHTFESIAWLDRDLADGIPDAATMLIGYNNCSAKQSAEMYADHLRLWIEKFAMKTGGKAAVVLIPTVPGVPRFFSQQPMAQATRVVAKEYNLPVAPIDTAIEKIGPQEYRAKFLADSVHPNPEGHKLFADILLKSFKK